MFVSLIGNAHVHIFNTFTAPAVVAPDASAPAAALHASAAAAPAHSAVPVCMVGDWGIGIGYRLWYA